MVCLFHDDYGPADSAFNTEAVPQLAARGWAVDASLLKEARNIGEAEAVERHLIRGESVSWCEQGYARVEQDTLDWFYAAALLFVLLRYLIMKFRARTRGIRLGPVDGQQRITC